MALPASSASGPVQVPDFRGMQALNAWLAGHDAGLLLSGPDPDGPRPLMHGVVVKQDPLPGATRGRWDVVRVWLRDEPGTAVARDSRVD